MVQPQHVVAIQNESSWVRFGIQTHMPRRMHPYAGVCCTAAKWLLGHSYSLQGHITMLHLFFLRFCTWISLQPPIRSWTWLYYKKATPSQNSTIHSAYGNIVNFSHESIIDQYAISALYSPPNCPFPFDDHHQNLIHPFRARPHSPPQTASSDVRPWPWPWSEATNCRPWPWRLRPWPWKPYGLGLVN